VRRWLQRKPAVCVHAEELRSRADNGDPGAMAERAALLLELTHAGQTVLTGITADAVGAIMPDGAWLADLGSHRLADLGRAERLWQLCHPDVVVEFPALKRR
jgi:class 3 adenylate cyclase